MLAAERLSFRQCEVEALLMQTLEASGSQAPFNINNSQGDFVEAGGELVLFWIPCVCVCAGALPQT